MEAPTERAANEIAHWRALAAAEIDATFGWTSPAGKRRAGRRAQLIAAAARLGPSTTAIEIGCGTGLFTEQFAATGARIVAVDLSPELLARAKSRNLPATVRLENRRFETLELTDPAFEDWTANGVDAVIGSSVLHHLEIPESIETCKKLLADGGRIAFAEPNLLNPQVWMERRFRKLFPYVSQDETAIVRWDLRRRLERAGFVDVRITPFDWLHPATPHALIGLVSGAGQLLEKVPIAREFAGSVLISATLKSSARA